MKKIIALSLGILLSNSSYSIESEETLAVTKNEETLSKFKIEELPLAIQHDETISQINDVSASVTPALKETTSQHIKLEQALALAYENNPQIKSYQEEYIASMQRYPEALSAGFLPNVEASSSTSNSKGVTNELGQAFPKHTTNNQRTIGVSQNLFAGGSSVATLASVKHQIDAAKIRYISQEQDFLSKATLAYIDVIISKERLEAANAYVVSLEKEFEAAEEKFKVGEATKTDVAAAKAEKSRAQVKKVQTNAEYLTRQSNFKTYFSIDPEGLIMPEVPADMPANFEIFEKIAMPVNLSIRSANSQFLASQNAARAAKGKLLPTVNASASKTRSDTRGDKTWKDVQVQNTYNTSLSLNIPILSQGGAEHSRVRAAKANLRKATFDVDYIKKAIKTQLIQDWESFAASKEAVISAQAAVDAKQLELEGIKSMNEVGMRTMLDVLKVEREYFETVVENISIKEQIIKAAFVVKADLAQLTAKHMGLTTKLFDPEKEFRKTKFKLIGF